MKLLSTGISAVLTFSLVISCLLADDAGYGKKKAHKMAHGHQYGNYHHYGPQMPTHYGPAAYGEQPANGYTPYGPAYRPVYAEQAFMEPKYPSAVKPKPFIHIHGEEEADFELPKWNRFHCFLKGAPWTECGRRDLTSYFLDQCIVLMYTMSASVDGICGSYETNYIKDNYKSKAYQHYGRYGPQPGQPRKPQYQPKYEEKAHNPYMKTSAPKTQQPAKPEYRGTGYSGADLAKFQEEKCLQKAYVSITLATVMCLTENIVRIKFIEYYAKYAKSNPIQGPLLHLKKLHTFIKNVVSCAGIDKIKNYPNIWLPFANSDGQMTYNPESPFELSGSGVAKTVGLNAYTSTKASGWEDFTTANRNAILCQNIDNLDDNGIYTVDRSDSLYYSKNLMTCGANQLSAAMNALPSKVKGILKRCTNKKEVAENGFKNSPLGPIRYTSDLTIRSVYDAVNKVIGGYKSIHRPLTIAENVASNAGAIGQPILEGHGILYYCAFYACKANHYGDLSKCFPAFNAETDWQIPSEIPELSESVDECLAKKWIIKEDLLKSAAVKRYIDAVDSRTHICMAEGDIVSFFDHLHGIKYLTTTRPGEAWQVAFFRKLSVEKCYTSITDPVGAFKHQKTCFNNKELYDLLFAALKDLLLKCKYNKKAYWDAVKKYSKQYKYGYRRRYN